MGECDALNCSCLNNFIVIATRDASLINTYGLGNISRYHITSDRVQARRALHQALHVTKICRTFEGRAFALCQMIIITTGIIYCIA